MIRVGDKVYEVANGKIYESTIIDIIQYEGKTVYRTEWIDFTQAAVENHCVFLERKEAEKEANRQWNVPVWRR